MDGNGLYLFQLLLINDVEVWQVKKDQAFCKTRSPLQVLYSEEAELFILRIDNFNWIMDKNLEVIVTSSEKDKEHTYLIPNQDGYFIIDAFAADSVIPLTNFETLLENTVHFMRRGGLDEKLGSLKKNGLIKKVEEKIAELAEGIKRVLSVHHESHPNQTSVRSFDQLKEVDKQSTPIVEISKDEIQKIWDEGEEVIRKSRYNLQWKNFRQGGNAFSSRTTAGTTSSRTIAGTGLTSQSFGETHDFSSEIHDFGYEEPTFTVGSENIDTKKVENPKDQQEFVGNENQRLPAYEVQSTKDEVTTGLAKASSQLGTTAPVSKDEDDDDEFTLGLFKRPGQEESNRGTAINTEINMTPQTSLTSQTSAPSDTWSITSNPSRSPKKDLDIPFTDPLYVNNGLINEGRIPPQA